MTDRDEKILKHVARYGVSLRAVIETLFFEGRSCDHVLNRLTSKKENRLTAVRIGRTKFHYYHLSAAEAASRGVPHRARARKGDALRVAVQVLWFSCMCGKKRIRLERKQISKQLGRGKGFGRPHVAEIDEQGGQGVVYRLYCPGARARADYVLKTLCEDYVDAQNHSRLSDWMRGGSFAFAVLVETPQRQAKLQKLIEKQDLSGIKILVEVVPGPMTLIQALGKRAEETDREEGDNA